MALIPPDHWQSLQALDGSVASPFWPTDPRSSRILVVLALALIVSAEPVRAEPQSVEGRRALVIGIDGLTGPALQRYVFGAGARGALRALIDAGVYAPCEGREDARCARTHDGPRHSSSFRWETAPGWGAVISGMNTAGHGIRGNDFEEQRLFVESSRAHPTFFKRLRDLGLRTAAGGVGNFLTSRDGEEIDPGVLDFECGLFGGALRVRWTDAASCNLDWRRADDLESEERDENLARWLIQRIQADDADVLMGVFDEVDAAGHSFGFADEGGYAASIAAVDELLGDLLAHVFKRAESRNQAWLVVLTSDHGGHDVLFGLFGSHDTVYFDDEAVPFVVATFGHPSYPLRPVTSPVRHMDVHPTVMEWFGVDAGDVDGRVQGIVPCHSPE